MPIGIKCGCIEDNCQAQPHKGKTSCDTIATENRFDNEPESVSKVEFAWPAGWEGGRCAPCAHKARVSRGVQPGK